MSVAVKHQEIIDKLYGIYQSNGFVSEDDALDAMVALKLPLHEIDSVSEHLLSMGVLIRTENDIEDEDDEGYDKSKIDYEALFNEVIAVDPGLTSFIEEVRAIQPPQHREWRNLMPQAKSGNQYAYNRLLEMYLRVVVKIAFSFYQRYDVPLADTIQNGYIGLVSALDKFEIGKQELFTTYAPWWIRQAIQREMDFTPFPLLYFPAHYQERLYVIFDLMNEHYCDECEQSAICENLIREVAEKLECDLITAKVYMRFYDDTVSIEATIDENDEAFNDNHLFADCMEEAVVSNQMSTHLHQAIKTLSDKEQRVVVLRYGLVNDREMTLEEVGNIMGVTRERIRQIEAKAFRKLRHPTKSKKLKEYL